MQNDGLKLKEFFVDVFLFIDKVEIKNFLNLTLNQIQYLILMVGVGIVISFLTGFLLGMIFKIVGYFK